MRTDISDRIRRLESLRSKIRAVRESILGIVLRMDDIELQRLPRIRADYALKIGCWEQALLEAELAGRRAKRRLALAQVQANRGDRPQMQVIDARLDAELAQWSAKVGQARDAYEHNLSYMTSMVPMSSADATELKHLYRLMVKRLHPDVRPSESDECAALFLLSQAAYHSGDLEALRSLEVATRHLSAEEDDLLATDDLEVLAQELELACIEEGVMQDRLSKLESSDEMRLGELLADPEWVTARTTELRKAVEEWERVRHDCNERLRKILEAFDA